jgi:hypothetical protein
MVDTNAKLVFSTGRDRVRRNHRRVEVVEDYTFGGHVQ